nr:hypothetical protein GCM10020093_041000 [Planobispora longispora]
MINELFKDEVVTKAIVRDVELPYGAGTMALITLDNGFDHTKPSTFGPGGLTSLDEALDAVAGRSDLAAVGVVGKPFIFAVGADLKGAALVSEREQALAIGKLGHDAFRRLGELSVPSFAFVNGAAMGGGLEVALHCTYRTISSGVPAVALPECFLGLVPGWGGTQLLPRLIGPANALKLIIENPLAQNRMIKGRDAFKLGIADAMFEGADFLEESLRWAAQVLRGEVTVSRTDHTAEDWSKTIADARFLLDMKLHGANPAPTGRWSWSSWPAPPPATRASTPRTRRWPTSSWATSCAPGSTPSTWCSAGPSGPPGRRTRRWPARSPRWASSARA